MGCHSQVVRQRSAKPSFPGPNPGGTSKLYCICSNAPPHHIYRVGERFRVTGVQYSGERSYLLRLRIRECFVHAACLIAAQVQSDIEKSQFTEVLVDLVCQIKLQDSFKL